MYHRKLKAQAEEIKNTVSHDMRHNRCYASGAVQSKGAAMDIRTQRTYHLLLGAFEQLLAEKNVEEITVSEICERSTVRRGTFYRHFADKQAFFRFYLQSITTRFLEQMGADEHPESLKPYAQHMHLALISFFEEKRGMVLHVLGPNMPAETLDSIVVQIARGIEERITVYGQAKGIELAASARFLSLHYAGGLIHTLREWISDGKPIPKEELVHISTNALMATLGK